MLRIHSLETFGTHEGPGIRLVVFLQGCNFRCAYCHNPDTISGKGGYLMSIKQILALLEEQRPYFLGSGGLTISGGEPGLQAVELINLFKAVKEAGFHTALDTNASLSGELFRKLLDLSDLALIDLKHINEDEHIRLTGQSNKQVLLNIEYREKKAQPFWIRYVFVPGWTDQEEHLEELGRYLSKFKYLERLEILPYHNLGVHKYKELNWDYPLQGVKAPSSLELEKALIILKKFLNKVIIRH